MARPSAVASAGLVVTANSWPAPPVASTVWSARTSVIRPSAPSASTPRHRPPSTSRSMANHPSSTAAALSQVASTRARSTSAPVAAPPAWTTRAVEWPPSRARARAPPGCRSKTAPMAISSLTRAGPSSTSTRTASVSHSPAPAARVSARWRSVLSSSPPRTAATPPWAHRVADWDSSPLVRTPTRSPAPDPPAPVDDSGAARRTAADRPATPLPSTRTSSATGVATVLLTRRTARRAPARARPGPTRAAGTDRGCRSVGPDRPRRR